MATLTHGSTYTFRAKAKDAAGNWSPWVESDPIDVELFRFFPNPTGQSFAFPIDPMTSEENEKLILQAASEWNGKAGVSIVPHPESPNVIVMTDFSFQVCGYYHPPTETRGFIIQVDIAKGGCVPAGTIAHELGHAFGLADMKWGGIQLMGYQRIRESITTPKYWDIEGVRRRWSS